MALPQTELSRIGLRPSGTDMWCWLPVASYTLPQIVMDRPTSPLYTDPPFAAQSISTHIELSLTVLWEHVEQWVGAKEDPLAPMPMLDVSFEPALLHPDRDQHMLPSSTVVFRVVPMGLPEPLPRPGEREWIVLDLGAWR